MSPILNPYSDSYASLRERLQLETLDYTWLRYHHGALSLRHALDAMCHDGGVLPSEAHLLLVAPDRPSENRGWR